MVNLERTYEKMKNIKDCSSKRFIISETSYGIKKRLEFIKGNIEKELITIKDKNKIQILDIGCGTGELLTIPLGNLGIKILGIDIHKPSIQKAKEINPYSNVSFKYASFMKLKEDCKFDFIILSEVLEHLKNPEKALIFIKQHLNPTGYCFITIPNGYGPFEIENRIWKILIKLRIIKIVKQIKNFFNRKSIENIKVNSKKDTLNLNSHHVQFFTIRYFTKLLNNAGLTVQKKRNRAFFAGPFSDKFINKFQHLIILNTRIADKLPSFLASGWMFIVVHKEDNQ